MGLYFLDNMDVLSRPSALLRKVNIIIILMKMVGKVFRGIIIFCWRRNMGNWGEGKEGLIVIVIVIVVSSPLLLYCSIGIYGICLRMLILRLLPLIIPMPLSMWLILIIYKLIKLLCMLSKCNKYLYTNLSIYNIKLYSIDNFKYMNI